jgi:hypothetical protein
MTEATSRTAARRPAPGHDTARTSIPLTSIHRAEADGVQMLSCGR